MQDKSDGAECQPSARIMNEQLTGIASETGSQEVDIAERRFAAQQTAPGLGTYVIQRPRKDGTYRIAFEVPARLRPLGWPATIPLPYQGRAGNLHDLSEVARIKQDAKTLLEELLHQRTGATRPEKSRGWDHLVELWQNTSKFKTVGEITKANYRRSSRRLLSYFQQHPELQPGTIKESEIETLLTQWDHSPDMKVDELLIIKFLMRKAVVEKWREDNPTKNIIYKRPSREYSLVLLWEEEDVQQIGKACCAAEYPEIAGIIIAIWEAGHRLTDTRTFRLGKEYANGMFRFWQHKTHAYVTIPVRPEFRELVEYGKSDGDYLFVDHNTGKPFTKGSLWEAFAAIRDTLPDYSERRLTLHQLRHSCVVQLARAGCTVPEIASITGHSLETVHRILEHYLPRDNELALHAMQKRWRMMDTMKGKDRDIQRHLSN